MKVVLYADDREKLSCVGLINQYIAEQQLSMYLVAVEMRLTVGDFQIFVDSTFEWAIERKTYDDFRQSFINRRLYSQIKQLTAARDQPSGPKRIGIILEGNRPATLTEGAPNYLAIAATLHRWRDYNRIVAFHTAGIGDTARELFLMMYDLCHRKSPGRSVTVIEASAMHALVDLKRATYVTEEWMYMPMMLSLFPGLAYQRAVDIAKNFNYSIAAAVYCADTSPTTFANIIADRENPSYRRAVPKKTVEMVLSAFTAQPNHSPSDQ